MDDLIMKVNDLEDTRQVRKIKHDLVDILVIVCYIFLQDIGILKKELYIHGSEIRNITKIYKIRK